MAIMAAAPFILTYLLAITSVQEMNVSTNAVQKLVDYNYSIQAADLIPGMRYNNSVGVSWAIGNASLRGLDGQTVTVKVSARALNDSGISFFSPFGTRASSAETYLHCRVANGTCDNSSVLFSEIPFTITITQGGNESAQITLDSEIVAGAPLPISNDEVQKSAGSIFDSLKNAFGNSTEGAQPLKNEASSSSGSSTNGSKDFLDSLKPEGDSKNPLEFLQSNPLISIAALGIVVVITGAYLLNTKD